MTDIKEEVYGTPPIIAAVHAGLECALFAEKIPDGDFVSIGMDILGAHSPDERMSISSYERTCDYLIKLLEALSMEEKKSRTRTSKYPRRRRQPLSLAT